MNTNRSTLNLKWHLEWLFGILFSVINSFRDRPKARLYHNLLALLALSLLYPSLCWSAPVVSLSAAGIKLEITENEGTFRASLEAEQNFSKAQEQLKTDVQVVDNPTRLVIDVIGFSSKTAKIIPVNHPQIIALRLGIHPDKLRFVIDLDEDLLLDFSIPPQENQKGEKQRKGNIDFKIYPKTEATIEELSKKEESPQIEEPTPIPPPVIEETPQPKVDHPPLTNQTPQPETNNQPPVEEKQITLETEKIPEINNEVSASSSTPSRPEQTLKVEERPQIELSAATISTQQPETKHSTYTLKGIFYQGTKTAGLSSVMLDIDVNTNCILSREENNLYRLTLEDTKLDGAHLTLPQFPPEVFSGFEVVTAAQEGNNVVVKIFVEDNIRLMQYRAQGKIWLKAAPLNR